MESAEDQRKKFFSLGEKQHSEKGIFNETTVSRFNQLTCYDYCVSGSDTLDKYWRVDTPVYGE